MMRRMVPPGDDINLQADIRRMETGCWACGDHVEIKAGSHRGVDAVAVQASGLLRQSGPIPHVRISPHPRSHQSRRAAPRNAIGLGKLPSFSQTHWPKAGRKLSWLPAPCSRRLG